MSSVGITRAKLVTPLGQNGTYEKLANGRFGPEKPVWEYTASPDKKAFFSSFISGAQRLPNGNTLITSGPTGRIFEVTKDGVIVWEYIWPYFGANNQNSVYRAYRIPYSWIPQLPKPNERRVTPPAPVDFRVP